MTSGDNTDPERRTANHVIDKFVGEYGDKGAGFVTDHARSMWNIVALSHLIVGEIDAMLAKGKLSAADIFVMSVILIEQGGDLRPSDVARILFVTPAAISLRLAKLERQHLIRRTSVAGDKRAIRLTLTAEGEALVTDFLQRVGREGRFAKVVSEMADEKRGQLETLLEDLTYEMDRHVIRP